MQTVILGKSGLSVSRVGFGGIPIQRITKEEAPALLRAVHEAGINYIDSARMYTVSEEYIGYALEKEGLRPDVITVDPPRKGLAPEVIASVAGMGPKRVVYVSCDPATLGRDIKIFEGFGYKAVRVCAVDMFPGTRHVESVVLLTAEA